MYMHYLEIKLNVIACAACIYALSSFDKTDLYNMVLMLTSIIQRLVTVYNQLRK